jgi:hypothetical protein
MDDSHHGDPSLEVAKQCARTDGLPPRGIQSCYLLSLYPSQRQADRITARRRGWRSPSPLALLLLQYLPSVLDRCVHVRPSPARPSIKAIKNNPNSVNRWRYYCAPIFCAFVSKWTSLAVLFFICITLSHYYARLC